jgi:hypothetical protein
MEVDSKAENGNPDCEVLVGGLQIRDVVLG